MVMFDDPLFASSAGSEEPEGLDDHHVGEWAPHTNGHKPNGSAAEQGSDSEDWRERGIEVELDKLRIRREAKRRLDDEERPLVILPAVKSLTTLLEEPDAPTRYRIEDVAPADGRVIISAQYKAGKTTIIGNLARSLMDGDPFLGRFRKFRSPRSAWCSSTMSCPRARCGDGSATRASSTLPRWPT